MASLLGILGALLLGGLGVPIPEDPALLATGALIYHGVIPAVLAFIVVFVAVLGGDFLLFSIARHLGPRVYERRLFRRILTPARRESFEEAYAKHGPKMVFIARHLAGLRAAAFALAGVHGMRPRTFLLWDSLSACISVPLIVTLGYVGALHLPALRAHLREGEHIALAAIVAAVLVFLIVRRVRNGRRVDRTRVDAM